MKSKHKHRGECPVALVAELIGDMWVLLIIRDLGGGPKRFNDLATSLSGISTRTLAAKLKMLEERGIVKRTAYRERPPRVEYALSPKATGLKKIIAAMNEYGTQHLLSHV